MVIICTWLIYKKLETTKSFNNNFFPLNISSPTFLTLTFLFLSFFTHCSFSSFCWGLSHIFLLSFSFSCSNLDRNCKVVSHSLPPYFLVYLLQILSLLKKELLVTWIFAFLLCKYLWVSGIKSNNPIIVFLNFKYEINIWVWNI